jgi:hypothetical protein
VNIMTDEFKVFLLAFGVLLLIPLAAMWVVSLGHIRLALKWWKFLEKQENRILYGE